MSRGSERVRVGVAGGGLIAQTAHLPSLERLRDRFELVALADPSETVRQALAARHGVRAHADWRVMLSEERLDAIVVCSPNGTHADIVLAALESGVHVLVEKPLCLSLEGLETICERRAQSGRIVQIGYQKRHDSGYESLLSALPQSGAEDLRFVDVVTYDPWMGRPPFVPADLVVGRDVPEKVRRDVAQREREQVRQAVGVGDPASVRVFSDLYAGAFIHDVNLVHGVLGSLGVKLPAAPVSAGHWTDGKEAGPWAAGKAANIAFRLPGGVGWQTAWILLEGLEEYRQTVSFAFGDQIHRLSFSSPYLREHATAHEIVGAGDGAERWSRSARMKDAYLAQLEHFHACIVEEAECRTPPEQARLDLEALRDAFLVDLAEGAAK